MVTNQNIPYTINGGDQMIAFTNRKNVASISGVMNYPSLYSWYEDNPEKNHLGLVNLWGKQEQAKYPNLMRKLMMDKSVLNVNGWDGEFKYSLPVEESKGCYTTKDVSYQEFAGIDHSTFKITLNKAYAPGDILTYDVYEGQQVVVTDEYPVEPDGDGFEHTVKLVTQSKDTYLLPEFLNKGIQWKKFGHVTFGEEFENYSNFELPDTIGTMECTFKLGSASAVESYITGKADSKAMSGASAKSKMYLDKVAQEFGEGNDYAILTDLKVVNGVKVPDIKTAKLGATMEFLTLRELERLTSERLMWAQAATFRDKNGVTRINEGLWRQLKRGKVITYPRPLGMTRDHIKEAVEYIFRINPHKPAIDRRIKFTVGKDVQENFFRIFKDEITSQRDLLSTWNGADAQIPSPVVGKDLKNLGYQPVRFTSAYIPDIGTLEVEHDPSMDTMPGADRLASGMHPLNKSYMSYSAIIWDADSQYYSNNKEMPKGATLVEGGNKGANIHLVKPEGNAMFWGTENGRYDYRKAGDIVSSSRKPGQNFWAFAIAAIHVMDVTRTVIIELEPQARRGYN
jgi:hypothetical protein